MESEIWKLEFGSRLQPDKVIAAIGSLEPLAEGSLQIERIDTFTGGTFVYASGPKAAADALRGALTRKGTRSRTAAASVEQLSAWDDLERAVAKTAKPARKPRSS